MSINQYFVPEEATKTTGHFYSNRNSSPIDIMETRLYDYMQKAQYHLVSEGFIFSDEDFRIIQNSSAFLDSIFKNQTPGEEANFFPKIVPGHHVVNVFYKKPGSDVFTLQFANAAYLDKLGKNLPDVVGIREDDLMNQLYKSDTIDSIRQASKQGYTAKFIEMDNISLSKDEDIPAFFWFTTTYPCPNNCGTLMVRIGMNGTGLNLEQKTKLTNLYKLTDRLRNDYMNVVSYANPSSALLVQRINQKLMCTLDDDCAPLFSLMDMTVKLSELIMNFSPLPASMVDKSGKITHISPAYAAAVGYKESQIRDEHFFDKIYPGVEGRLVKESIAAYMKNGYYPEGSSFMLTRGKAFRRLEEHMGIPPIDGLELIPNIYSFIGGAARLNTVRPLAPISGFGNLADTRPMEYFPETEPSPLENRAVAEWLKNQNL